MRTGRANRTSSCANASAVPELSGELADYVPKRHIVTSRGIPGFSRVRESHTKNHKRRGVKAAVAPAAAVTGYAYSSRREDGLARRRRAEIQRQQCQRAMSVYHRRRTKSTKN